MHTELRAGTWDVKGRMAINDTGEREVGIKRYYIIVVYIGIIGKM